VLFVFCTLKIAVFTKQRSELVYLQIIFLHITRATLRDKSDFSKNSHSTETNFNYSSNFESAKNVRSSNVVEFEFKLRHIPSMCAIFIAAAMVHTLHATMQAVASR